MVEIADEYTKWARQASIIISREKHSANAIKSQWLRLEFMCMWKEKDVISLIFSIVRADFSSDSLTFACSLAFSDRRVEKCGMEESQMPGIAHFSCGMCWRDFVQGKLFGVTRMVEMRLANYQAANEQKNSNSPTWRFWGRRWNRFQGCNIWKKFSMDSLLSDLLLHENNSKFSQHFYDGTFGTNAWVYILAVQKKSRGIKNRQKFLVVK